VHQIRDRDNSFVRDTAHYEMSFFVIDFNQRGSTHLRKELLVVKHRSMRLLGFLLLWLATVGLLATTAAAADKIDLSGEWEIQEEERSYIATLDAEGNGPYTWQNGRLTTTAFTDGHWEGTWQQAGNDREGGFDVLLGPEHNQASGRWWYTRVGQQIIPPGEWGGNFTWKRLSPVPASP
jgi:hypothetical protein